VILLCFPQLALCGRKASESDWISGWFLQIQESGARIAGPGV
jgi:hypothetical protein